MNFNLLYVNLNEFLMTKTLILVEKYLCDSKYHCSNNITVIEHVIVKTSFGLVLWKGNLGGRYKLYWDVTYCHSQWDIYDFISKGGVKDKF